MPPSPYPVAVAPMLDWTDRHFRYVLRLVSPSVRLYTEMITTGALLRGDAARHLAFDPAEHPVALQLGGSEPEALARCARLGEEAGYDEINLNLGCPSDRVREGRFGACLMAEPRRVADCVAAMKAAVAVPVTVKTRIGIDERDSYEELAAFVDGLRAAGLDALIVHARKAWLQGLSPRENREIPPLDYERVYRLKREFAELPVTINGGITTAEEVETHLRYVDGVMIGRAVCQDPWLLARIERRRGGDVPASPEVVVRRLLPYLERELARGTPLARITRPLLGFFHGVPGARRWRRMLSEGAHSPGAGPELVEAALAAVAPAVRADQQVVEIRSGSQSKTAEKARLTRSQ